MTNSTRALRPFIISFAFAVLLYALAFHFIENRRTRNGPWEVTFANDSGAPALIINQSKLNIANVKLVFPDQKFSGTNTTLVFSKPRQVPFDLPFGKCVFEDTTFQPGTLVFSLFGREVQLMPRVLTIDRQEYAWQSNETITLKTQPGSNKADTSRGAP